MKTSTLIFLRKTFVIVTLGFLFTTKAQAYDINVTSINGTQFCGNAQITAAYTLSGSINNQYNHYFSIQLSNSSGSFASGVQDIGVRRSVTAGTIVGTLPANLAPGSNYRVRVTSSTQFVDNYGLSNAFTVVAAPAVPVLSSQTAITLCQGSTAPAITSYITASQDAYWVSNNRLNFKTTEAAATSANTQLPDGKPSNFSTNVNNLTILSVDYGLLPYQSGTVKIGIYDANGNLLATESSSTIVTNSDNSKTITANFNYKIVAAGNYYFNITEGSGQFRQESFTGPVTQGSITLTSAPSGRLFNNIQYTTTQASTTPPTISTATVGTTIYNVLYKNASGCDGPALGITITINTAPIVTSATGSGNVCTGSQLALSSATASGTWTSSNTSIATVNSSTGIVTGVSAGMAVISYTVSGNSCGGTYTVNVSKTPNSSYTVTGSGSYCKTSGSTGLAIGLSGSESGMSYQLLYNGVTLGSPLSGTGAALSFGNQTGAGRYTVQAVNSGSGSCPVVLGSSATISLSNELVPLGGIDAVPLASRWYENNSGTSNNQALNNDTGSELTFGYVLGSGGRSQYLYMAQNGRPFAVTSGKSYVVTFDFRNSGLTGSNLVSMITARFGTAINNGNNATSSPSVYISPVVSSTAVGTNAYVSLSFTIVPTSTATAFLAMEFQFAGQPNIDPRLAIKNLKITPVVDAICSENTATFISGQAATATSYAWYTTATGGMPISGANSASYTTPVLINTTLVPVTVSYYVAATGACESERAKIDVIVNPKPIVADQTTVACSGKAFTFVPNSVPAGTTYTWTAGYNIIGGSNQTTPQTSISQTLNGVNNLNVTYTVTPYNGSCAGAPFTLTVTINSNAFVWKGTNNTSWTNAANWGCAGAVPSAGSDVIIEDVANKPVMAGDVTVNSLILQGNTTLTIGANTLTITGTLGGMTNLIGSSTSKLVIGGMGTTAMPIGFNQSTAQSRTLATYTQARPATVTLSNPLSVNTSVTLTGNTSILASAGNLTLLAPTAGTNANVGPLTGTSAITGDVNIQMWMTGGDAKYRSTRMISSPINDAGTNKNFFQQLQSFMFITGPGNTANGFDLGGTAQPNAVTLTTYNETKLPSVSAFDPLANILTATKSIKGKGYFLFYRGDRTTNTGLKLNATANVYAIPETQLLTFTGPINAANVSAISFPVINSNIAGDSYNGYNALGNPFPSAISWAALQANNSTVLSPNIVSIIMPDGLGLVTVSGGIVVNNLDNVNAAYIQPGQGFYIKAANSGNVVFAESIKAPTIYNAGKLLDVKTSALVSLTDASGKTTSSVNSISAVSGSAATTELLRINLADAEHKNETAVVFNDGNLTSYGQGDAIFFSGNTVSISTLTSDNYQVAINFMPKLDEVKTLKIAVNSTSSGNVTMNFTDLSAVSTKVIYLKDNYLNQSVQINAAQSSYPFYIDKNITGSFGTERFVLNFEEPAAPERLASFTAVKNTGSVTLKWRPAVISDNTFELERASDPGNFSTVNHTKSNGTASYTYTDLNPVKGDNFYRLKESNIFGVSLYSEILTVNFAEGSHAADNSVFTIYPNPTANELNVNLKLNSPVQLTIYDLKGKPVLKNNFDAKQPINENITTLINGFYFVELTDLTTAKTIGITKFYKL